MGISDICFSATIVSAALIVWHSAEGSSARVCEDDSAGLILPPGFCAVVLADNVGRARHATVADNGDVFLAIGAARWRGDHSGGVLALRDADGDGVADRWVRFGDHPSSDVRIWAGFLYVSTLDAIVRYPLREGHLRPVGEAEIIVQGLPRQLGHGAKSMAFNASGSLFVNIGSLSNSCQLEDRRDHSPGMDPCPELESHAGIWMFDAEPRWQADVTGRRYATGMRNTVALAIRPQNGKLYGVMHGRDRLYPDWTPLFTKEKNAETPAEEFVLIEDGDDFGWPYCYYDTTRSSKVLAPEYGGDGTTQGRCVEVKDPLIAFPAHWAPNGLMFYSGTSFPSRFDGGAFIAFHGSWDRAPLPQDGYYVVFAPFENGHPTGEWEVFARGFSTEPPSMAGPHRPVGLAQAPDGSVIVTDDVGGRIYRISYTGL